MNVVTGAKTDPGRRPNNEDQLSVVDVRRHGLQADSVLVIADGMGGRNFGERASAVAVETVQETLIEMLAAERADGVDTGEALASALRKANARVYDLGRQSEETQGMGTTCVAAVVQGETLSVAHAGDSRAYLLREGVLERLTEDHSYVAEQVRAGVISEESAQRSRFRNVITRAVGIEPTITPDVSQRPIQPNDILLLCTDGLTNMVPEDQITRVLQQGASPQNTAERLVQLANRNGGRDNITAIVARLEISNRTQRLLPAELRRVVDPAHRTQKMQRTRTQEVPVLVRPESAGNGPAPTAKAPPAAAPAAPVWPVLSTLIILALLGVVGYLAYRLQRHLGPVGAVNAPRPARPVAVDLSHLHYDRPQPFYVKPVQGGLLTLNQADGSLTVATQAGQVVRLDSKGGVLAQYTPALPPVASDGNQHFAADPQGDIYISDTAARTIHRYTPDGRVGVIADPRLTHPASLAAAADGTLYVVDAERLMVLHPLPPGYKPLARPVTLPAPLGLGSDRLWLDPQGGVAIPSPHSGHVAPPPHAFKSPSTLPPP